MVGIIALLGGYNKVAYVLFAVSGIMPLLIFFNFVFTTYHFFDKTIEQNNEIIEMLDDYIYEEDGEEDGEDENNNE